MDRIIKTVTAAETEALGRSLARTLHGGAVVALYGGLGMGKTTFVRGLAAGLGVVDAVSSPTFALVHHYRGHPDLYHFDLYRVDGWDDLDSTGFFDALDSGGILVVEWSEHIEAAIPENAIRIEIARGEGDNERVFHIKGEDDLADICH